MAKWFVGQRVRHVKSFTGRVAVGAEGHISEIRQFKSDIGMAECVVIFPGFQNGKHGERFAGRFEQLEPILPEGAAPSIYSFGELLVKLREGERV